MNPLDIANLAQQAMAHLRPELLVLAAKSGEGAAGEAGKQVISWLRDRFKSTPVEPAINDAIAHPGDERRLAVLETQLEFALEEQADLRRQLQEFLGSRPAVAPVTQQTADVHGTDHTVTQVAGDHNTTSIH